MEKNIDQRFAQVDQRFVQMEKNMDQRFAQVDTRFAEIERRQCFATQGGCYERVRVTWRLLALIIKAFF